MTTTTTPFNEDAYVANLLSTPAAMRPAATDAGLNTLTRAKAQTSNVDAARRANMEAKEQAELTTMPRPEFKADAGPLDELLRVEPDPAENTPRAHRRASAEVDRLQAAVSKIEFDLAKAQNRLEELEDSRADIVLNGGDPDKLHSDVYRAEQMIKTLNAGLSPARAMLAKATAVAKRAQIERQAAKVKAEHQGKLAEALETLHEFSGGVEYTAKLLDEHAEAINSFNHQALAAGRADLVISLDAIRQGVIDKIGRMHASFEAPVRMGESDAQFEARLLAKSAEVAKGRKVKGQVIDATLLDLCRAMQVERLADEEDQAFQARQWAAVAATLGQRKTDSETEADHHERVRGALAKRLKIGRTGEPDSAYSLRVGNAHMMAAQARDTSDPLRAIGEQAIKAIQKHALGLDAASLHRLQHGLPAGKLHPGDMPKGLRTSAYGPLSKPVSLP